MEKKKIYVFVVHSIAIIGGTEMYVAGKAKYLESLGWEVYIFSPEPQEIVPVIPSVAKYLKIGGGCRFLGIPPYKFKTFEQERFLKLMTDKLSVQNWDDCEIIVESFVKSWTFWAELFAAKVKGRHFFTWLHEDYDHDFWRDDFDYFYFKLTRNEFIANAYATKKFFNGYKNVTAPFVEFPDTIREMDPVQDVDFPIEKILKCDWNICHVGRSSKNYVLHVIEGIGELARRYPNKTINFICVGNMDSRMELLKKTFNGLKNIYFTPLGDMVPIPRNLFSKVDVVCAISQSARFAANEGVLTIVGNSDTPEGTPGVLGYDTTEQLHGKPIFSYVEALENVLVKKLYDGKKYGLPKLEPAEKYYERFWTIVKNAAPPPPEKYYVERLSQERIRSWTAIFPFATIARGAKIIFFGATEIAKDYRRQIQSQENSSVEFGGDYVKQLKAKPYCEIVATVDEHPEEFDDSVVGVERLKQKDYDAIVVTTFPQNAQAARDTIIKTVPEMANRLVYNFQVLPT